MTTEDTEIVTDQNVTPVDYSKLNLSQIATCIGVDWRKQKGGVNYAAKPYLDAMSCLNSIKDNYGADTGISIVAYFLSNASTWKGEIAKAIKLELKKRLKAR